MTSSWKKIYCPPTVNDTIGMSKKLLDIKYVIRIYTKLSIGDDFPSLEKEFINLSSAKKFYIDNSNCLLTLVREQKWINWDTNEEKWFMDMIYSKKKI